MEQQKSTADLELAGLQAGLEQVYRIELALENRLGILLGAEGVVLAAMIYISLQLGSYCWLVKGTFLGGAIFIGLSLVYCISTLRRIRIVVVNHLTFEYGSYGDDVARMKGELVEAHRDIFDKMVLRTKEVATRFRVACWLLMVGMILTGVSFFAILI